MTQLNLANLLQLLWVWNSYKAIPYKVGAHMTKGHYFLISTNNADGRMNSNHAYIYDFSDAHFEKKKIHQIMDVTFEGFLPGMSAHMTLHVHTART